MGWIKYQSKIFQRFLIFFIFCNFLSVNFYGTTNKIVFFVYKYTNVLNTSTVYFYNVNISVWKILFISVFTDNTVKTKLKITYLTSLEYKVVVQLVNRKIVVSQWSSLLLIYTNSLNSIIIITLHIVPRFSTLTVFEN